MIYPFLISAALLIGLIIFIIRTGMLSGKQLPNKVLTAYQDKTQIFYEADIYNLGDTIEKAIHPVHIIMAEKQLCFIRKTYKDQINPVSLEFDLNTLRNQIRDRKDFINNRMVLQN